MAPVQSELSVDPRGELRVEGAPLRIGGPRPSEPVRLAERPEEERVLCHVGPVARRGQSPVRETDDKRVAEAGLGEVAIGLPERVGGGYGHGFVFDGRLANQGSRMGFGVTFRAVRQQDT